MKYGSANIFYDDHFYSLTFAFKYFVGYKTFRNFIDMIITLVLIVEFRVYIL